MDSIVLVVKGFPTRNQQGLGSLPFELSAGFVEDHKHYLGEAGGGRSGEYGPQRRVALFDFDMAKRAALANALDYLAVTGLDKLKGVLGEPEIASYGSVDQFLSRLETHVGVRVGLQSWGPAVEDVIDHRLPHRAGRVARARVLRPADSRAARHTLKRVEEGRT